MTEEMVAQTGFFSLAELASMNTDEVQTLTSRVPPTGIFDVEGVSVAGKTRDPVEGKPPLHAFNFVYKVLGGQPTDPTVDVEKMVDRRLTESYTLWPDQLVELIGLLKGRYQKIGLPNAGMALGGVEGSEPGWLDTIVGHKFRIRIRSYTDKTGETRVAYDYVGPIESLEGGDEAEVEVGESAA